MRSQTAMWHSPPGGPPRVGNDDLKDALRVGQPSQLVIAQVDHIHPTTSGIQHVFTFTIASLVFGFVVALFLKETAPRRAEAALA